MYKISKAVIIFPIAIVIISLFFKFTTPPSKKVVGKNVITPTITKEEVNSLMDILEKKDVDSDELDLKGPWICDFSSKDASISAKIKDKEIYVKTEQESLTNNLLISGDCYYEWQEGMLEGKKTCGISSFISIFETMTNFGLIGYDAIFPYISQLALGDSISTDEADIKRMTDSCEKQVVEDIVFEIPKNINFKLDTATDSGSLIK